MKKYSFSLFIVFLLFLSLPSFAQIEDEKSFEEKSTSTSIEKTTDINCSAIRPLEAAYGSVMAEKSSDYTIKLTLSIPRSEIENMLTMVVAEKWYPTSLFIKGVGINDSLIKMDITKNMNDSSRRFRVLQKLCMPGTLTWKNGEIDAKDAYVTSIETDFGEDFVVIGETIKSNLIFKNLSPKIRAIGPDKENLDSERFASKKTFDRTKIFTRETYYDNDTGINGQPFFEHGTYKEDPKIGRYMIFTIRCKW